jgi:predicted HTH transcriptional regulator
MHFHGREVRKPIPSYHIYKGTAFELVDQATDFVMSKVNRAVIPRDGKVTSDVAYELPFKAVREAIVNAITHRDYTSNASVQVMLFADRLEVWNPGQLPPGLTIADLRKSHASIPHNPLIAEPMFLSTYAEKAGSGIIDMFALCRQAKLPPPEFRQQGGQFVQTIWRPKVANTSKATQRNEAHDQAHDFDCKGTKSAPSRNQVKLLRMCLIENTLLDLMNLLGRSDRTKFRNQVLNPMIYEGLVEMTIPDKPNSRLQKYRLTAKGKEMLEALNT